MKNHTLITVLALAACSTASYAAEAVKTHSGLSMPVAYEDRRALSIDRSNFTYAPLGIDSGVIQVELGVVDYVHDASGIDGDYDQFTYGVASLRFGVLNNFEVGVILPGYINARLEDLGGAVTRAHGIGDTLLQARYTFAGYDGEKVGTAIMPYVKLPTNNVGFNDEIEFGTQVPLAYAFEGTPFCVCASPGFDMNYNGKGDGFSYDFNPFLGVAFWYAATGELSLFNEWYVKKLTGAGTGDNDVISYIGLGGTYLLGANDGLDFGMNYGLTQVTADWNFRIGYTHRF